MFCKSNVTQLSGRAKNVNTGKLAPEFMLLIIHPTLCLLPFNVSLETITKFWILYKKRDHLELIRGKGGKGNGTI